MAKSNKRKSNKVKKKNNNIKNKNVINEEIKQKGSFMAFMKKKWVKVILHICTVIIWILFLADFFTFRQLNTVPNTILSILALITLALEWNVLKN